MSFSIKAFAVLGLALVVSACSKPVEEEIVYIEEPVIIEPVLNKY
ncbi:hypothetical protein [Cochlodiniinecator piscidefendens]|nr:hypothetical protein [Cochlodiniinecator piscidefendens]